MKVKNKIKKTIMLFSIIYSIVIISLMLYTYSTSINTLEFNDASENIVTLNEYKDKLQNIEDNSCKNSLNGLINHYEKTSYNGNVNLKDKIMNEKGVLYYITEILQDCNLTDEVRKSIAFKSITASIQIDEVLQNFFFQYELKIPDFNNRSTMETNLNSIRYQINRKNQLDIIKLLIDVLEGELKYE